MEDFEGEDYYDEEEYYEGGEEEQEQEQQQQGKNHKKMKQGGSSSVEAANANAPTAEEVRLSRLEQRQLLLQRKAAKPNASLIQECKKYWELVRTIKTPKDRKQRAMVELMALVKGKCVEIIFRHDASRIIQSCLKHGNQEQRNTIAAELNGHYLEVSKSQYGKFIVSKILQFCPAHRTNVIKSFYGKVQKLIKHRFAAAIIEECYSDYANAQQRTALMEEFYGPEFAIFKSSAARSLKELLASNPAKSPAILNHLKTTLFNLLGKSGIEIGQHTIIHRALLDYIMQISFQEEKTASTASTFTQEVISETPAQSPVAAASSAPAPLDADGNPIVTGANAAVNIPKTAAGAMSELIDLLQDHLIHILHTREGSQVTQLCITHASPKQRKQLIKSFKSYVKKIAMETYGCAALVSLLECVDDTVLVGKQILSELFADARVGDAGAETNGGEGVGFAELCRDKNASRVLMYLVLGRSRKYLPSFVVIELEKMDSIRRRTSKKDLDAKQRELMKVALPAMLKGILENADELLRCKTASSLVAETLKYAARSESAVEQCKAIVEKLAEMASGLPSLIKFNDVDMEVDLTKKADEEEEEGDEDDEESEEEEEEEDSSAAKEKQPAPTTVTTTTTTTTAKSSTKAFNAVQKLRDAKVAQKQLASGINLNEHVLVSRAATFAYKDLISNRAAVCSGESNESQTSGGIRDMLVPALAAAIAPHMQYWISYCCASPQTTSGTAFILVSLLESGNAQVVKEVKKAIKGAEGFKDAANSVTEWRKSVGDATAAKPVVATTTASKGKKRKNGGVDKKTIDQGVKKNTGIEILLSLL